MTSISDHRRHNASRRRRSGRTLPSRVSNAWRSAFTAHSSSLVAIATLWIALLLLGGSSRNDVAQLILLRPIAVVIAAYGLSTLRIDHIRHHRFLFAMAFALVMIPVLHLIPLPHGIWSALPGREIIADVDWGIGATEAWRPMTMAPALTWNALFALIIPLAALIHAAQLSNDDMVRAGPIIIVGAIASAVLGFFQLFEAPNSFLYPYVIGINEPEAVGFFANRNHQALMLATMFPLLAAFAARRGISATKDRRRQIIAAALGAFLVPVIIVAGSRAGLITAAIGLISVPFILSCGAKVKQRAKAPVAWLKYTAGLIAVLIIAGLLVATNRSIAIQRLVGSLTEEDQRYISWSAILDNYHRFMPFGSGAGSYEPVFQTFEPRNALTSSYSNHAHNDWLEVIMTAGLPGVVLLVIAVGAFLIVAFSRLRARDRGPLAAYRFAGLVIVLLIGLASIVDYPLRTPIIGALLVVACVWAGGDCRAPIQHEASDDGASTKKGVE